MGNPAAVRRAMSGYTPVFGSIFQGTLCGRWPDTGVWLCLLALADKHGHVDMTLPYISAVTGVPVETLGDCVTRFMEPDPQSRTKEDEGRRLRSIDASRGWGWVVINHAKYREKARLQAKDSRRTDSGEDVQRKRRDRTESAGLYYRENMRCSYCGDRATGPDAIDCKEPHVEENCVPACHRCNTSKHTRPLLTFLNTCKWVKSDVVMADEKLSRLVNFNGNSFVPRNYECPPSSPSHTHTQTHTQTHSEASDVETQSNSTPLNTTQPEMDMRYADLAIPLREAGVQVTSMHPVLVGWVNDGFTLDDCLGALAIARQAKGQEDQIHANYLDKIVRSKGLKTKAAAIADNRRWM